MVQYFLFVIQLAKYKLSQTVAPAFISNGIRENYETHSYKTNVRLLIFH